jgi:predicted kinase
MNILSRVEASLQDFRPQTTREFVALQIATRFQDRARLARYLNMSRLHSQQLLLETARTAMQEAVAGRSPTASDAFFRLLEAQADTARGEETTP